jgi:UDP-2,3-diacylglucosamine pyrophosphatase LpxH
MTKNIYDKVIISDIHLGSASCMYDEINKFFDSFTTNELILNGDIIDGWALTRRGTWRPEHLRILRKIIKLAEKGTKVVWVVGNHDDFLRKLVPMELVNIDFVDEYEINVGDKKLLVIHGDILDIFVNKFKYLSILGSIGYEFALYLNRILNNRRKKKGLDYFSYAKKIKKNVKKATEFINQFEENAVEYAKKKGFDGIVCGHIHEPKANEFYYNSGDWCESCTALILDNGQLSVYDYFSEIKESQPKPNPTKQDEGSGKRLVYSK